MSQDPRITECVEAILTNYRVDDRRLLVVWAKRLAETAATTSAPTPKKIRQKEVAT